MASALLAKLKINNPPAVKNQIEINIRGNPKIKEQGQGQGQGQKEQVQEQKEQAQAQQGQEPRFTIIDESKTMLFDRNTFLKSIRKIPDDELKSNAKDPILLPTETDASKKKTTRKIRPKTGKKKDTIVSPIKMNVEDQNIVNPVINVDTLELNPVANPLPEPVKESGEIKKDKKMTVRRTKKPIIGVIMKIPLRSG